MRRFALPLLALATATLSACDGGNTAEEAPSEEMTMGEDTLVDDVPMAAAILRTIEGEEVGTATATDSADGLVINVDATNMPEGSHPMHIHEVGSCDDGFAAAGGHWAPGHNMPDAGAEGHAHGAEHHMTGDLPNLEIAADGTGSLTTRLPETGTFSGLMDQDGSSIMVHTTDGKSAGASGDRYACGVFTAS